MTLLSSKDAAEKLGISVPTLYDLLTASDHGNLSVRGQLHTVVYYQGGPCGQGRIKIDEAEVDRLLAAMRVVPRRPKARQACHSTNELTHISSKLGRPSD